MKINNKKGSMTLFVALAMTAIISVTGIFIHELMKKKMLNNMIRSEDLISESILNTYDQRLYQGFMLLGYDPKSPSIEKVIDFYEDKHQVDIDFTPVQMLDDREIIRQSKLVVNTVVGLSAVDNMIVKVGLKDDIISIVKNSRNMMDKSEKALKLWDQASEKLAGMLDTIIDLKNLYEINEMDDSEISKLETTLNKASSILRGLRGSINGIDSGERSSNTNGSKGSLDLSSIDLRDENMKIYTLDGTDLDIELQSLYQSLKKYRSYKKRDKETYDIEESIVKIIENIEFDNTYYENDSRLDGESMLTSLKDVFIKDKEEYKEMDKDNDLVRSYTASKSSVELSITEKAYMMEYFTISCSDKVKSNLRDNHHLSRDYTDTIGQYELEYILSGKTGTQAVNNIKNKIRLIRFGFNTFHLAGDKGKSTTIDAVSTAIFAATGVPPQITKGIIITVWSSIETEADIRLIYGGKGVPLYKTESDAWKTDLDMENFKGETQSGSKSDELNKKDEFYYLYYNDYLRIIGMGTSYDDMIYRFKALVTEYSGVKEFDMEKLAVSHEIYILDKGLLKQEKKQVIRDGY